MANDDYADTDIAVTRSKSDLQQPPKYQVLMLNDDYTPMNFVIEVLEELFNMEREAATRTMMKIHTEGQALCGIFTFEIAEAKVEQVNSYAQQHGHPLQCTMAAE